METPERTPTVSFAPPIPFTSEKLGAGFVVAASRGWLQLQLNKDFANDSQSVSLNLLLPNGRSYVLRGDYTSARDGIRVHKDDLPTLDEILGTIRKDQHIRICQQEDVESSDRFTGFDELQFVPCALPDLAWNDLDASRKFLGRVFAAPLLITGMTGGIQRGASINRNLAIAAAAFDIPMGVGSQRLALDNPEYESIFKVRPHGPNVFLISNLGLAQLNQGYDLEVCKRAVGMIEANALAIHLNVVQEVVQVEGDRDFRALLDKIHTIANGLDVPVIVKEVGSGIDPVSAKKLFEAGVAAIDIAGRGGTSWPFIEGLRSDSNLTRQTAETFRNWGIPTAYALTAALKTCPGKEVIATGGIRNGLMVAKAVGLGAQMVGIGLPLLKAALEGPERVCETIETFITELKTAMICTNARTLSELRSKLTLGQPFRKAFTETLEQN